MSFHQKLLNIPKIEDCLPGRPTPISISGIHAFNGNKINPPFPEEMGSLVVGMCCFWGAERVFWQLDGVWVTAVGYSCGHTPNPTYEEVCTGKTGHVEVVLIKFDENIISFQQILNHFWKCHDPTQLNRQGLDVGKQYRSAIFYYSKEQHNDAMESKEQTQITFQRAIVTEIMPAQEFYLAENYHQLYFFKRA